MRERESELEADLADRARERDEHEELKRKLLDSASGSASGDGEHSAQLEKQLLQVCRRHVFHVPSLRFSTPVSSLFRITRFIWMRCEFISVQLARAACGRCSRVRHFCVCVQMSEERDSHLQRRLQPPAAAAAPSAPEPRVASPEHTSLVIVSSASVSAVSSQPQPPVAGYPQRQQPNANASSATSTAPTQQQQQLQLQPAGSTAPAEAASRSSSASGKTPLKLTASERRATPERRPPSSSSSIKPPATSATAEDTSLSSRYESYGEDSATYSTGSPINIALSAHSRPAASAAAQASPAAAATAAGGAAEASGARQQLNSQEKKQQIKGLIDRIPTNREQLFAYPIDWSLVDAVRSSSNSNSNSGR